MSPGEAERTRRWWHLPAGIVGIIFGGLLLRLYLLPFAHPWDGMTFWNLFAQLANGENPYLTFQELTLGGRSRVHFGGVDWYEYYAYPPLLIYLYWPLAQLVNLVTPLATTFVVPGSPLPFTHDLWFLLAFKAPVWIADVAIAVMLWRMTGRKWPAALYMLNPLVVLVSGAWMFDSIPAALVLAAVMLFERGRYEWAGALLGLGFVAKIYPLFLLPVFVMALIWRKNPRAFSLAGAFAGVSALACLPFLPEVAVAFEFNAGRHGGGLSLHQIPLSWLRLHGADTAYYTRVLSPALGTLMLFGGLALTYLALDRYRPGIRRGVLITLLAFLLCTKIVNEQYALWVLPFLILGLADLGKPRLGPRTAATWRFAGTHVAAAMLWVVPLFLAFAGWAHAIPVEGDGVVAASGSGLWSGSSFPPMPWNGSGLPEPWPIFEGSRDPLALVWNGSGNAGSILWPGSNPWFGSGSGGWIGSGCWQCGDKQHIIAASSASAFTGGLGLSLVLFWPRRPEDDR